MCERSPLGLSHAQNCMSGRPQVAEILLMRSPQTPPTCGQKFGYTKKKSPESVGKISGSNISTPVAGGTTGRRQDARWEGAGAPSTVNVPGSWQYSHSTTNTISEILFVFSVCVCNAIYIYMYPLRPRARGVCVYSAISIYLS
jgi:hypothetical protein